MPIPRSAFILRPLKDRYPAMTASAFSEGTVAFLDILGFKALVDAAESDPARGPALSDLVRMLDDHVEIEKGRSHPDVSERLKPDWIFISDSLIISSLNDAGDDRDLAAVMVKTIRIANRLLAMGYLIRGGISRGPVWRKPANIFGSAYIQAYAQEQTTQWPRIQLSKQAEKVWKNGRMRDYLPVAEDLDVTVVDLFHPYYSTTGTHQEYFERLGSAIEKNLAALPEWSAPRLKWEWVRDFVRRTRSRHRA
ncbi:hypothetical protein [Hyphomicrobium sp. D-2]|uniref:hypothetical protein n=1 Tax=Hyphomicrobium sp. D-2 TaxID=3041621 RepID=UPI0024574B3C|nr:hypothetical protein [Hyphomicrobium sp. D-2]MDH4980948.1 hypothetical protein [Hyphomicrobium sp. D-2]